MSNKKGKVLGNLSSGLLFVMSAPAGTGKTTLMRMLQEEFDCVVSSISYTSREPRPGETDKKDYNFISPEEFEKKISAGDFLEYVELYGDYYGTDKSWVAAEQKKGRHVFLVIDTQGALQLKEKIEATFIFILPPSFEELGRRLQHRRTESEAMIKKRLDWASKEIEASSMYDYHIINEDKDTTYQVLRSIVVAEEHRVR